jgi:thioredoxin 2
MKNAVILVCAHCAQMNRIPSTRLAEQPRCGSCKHLLIAPQPIALDDHNFERFVTRSELPVVVDFWAAWCGPCKMMAPIFAQAAERLSPRVVLAKVDTEAAPLTASRYNIRSIPTLLVLRDGFEVARQSGAVDLARLLAFVAPHVDIESGHA